MSKTDLGVGGCAWSVSTMASEEDAKRSATGRSMTAIEDELRKQSSVKERKKKSHPQFQHRLKWIRQLASPGTYVRKAT